VRVALTTVLGFVCSIWLPGWIGLDARWGVVGLTASAGVAGWVEFFLLRRKLNLRIGSTGLARSLVAKLWIAAGIGAAAAWAIKMLLPLHHPIAVAAFVLIPYGLIYFAITSAWGLEEARSLVGRLKLINRQAR
jgi:putative peptidoglycan lipid II flippase